MSTVAFEDNLYGSDQLSHLGGCGLLGFSRGSAGWCYERHDKSCKPGLWRVATYAMWWDELVEDFATILQSADAVVDDFGNLRKVQ